MQRVQRLAATIIACGVATQLTAQDPATIENELASIDAQIAEVDATLAQSQSGLIVGLAQARREALLLARTVLENRQRAERGEARLEITVAVVQPDEEKASQLLGEIALVMERIEEAEREAAQGGGLIQALALSRVETEKLTLAQLQMGYLQAKYGIAFPVVAARQQESSSEGTAPSASVAPSGDSTGTTEQTVPWADSRYPDIDYSLAPFEQAHRDGDTVSGWWTIKSEQAAIDDSPKITAVNYSAFDPNSYTGLTALIARCIEGETAVVFIQDDFLMSDFRSNSFDMTLRIDDTPAQQTRWSSLTSNKGAGLFGQEAERFLREIYDAQRLFIRLTEHNGQRHDASFELAGGEDAFESVAAACGWTTLTLTPDDYRAIQTLLNAGGFDAGTPDGQWGQGSQRAMKAFQASVGLPETGAPDRVTLSALGFGD